MLYAILLMPLMAMIGLAIDVSVLFARQHELQNIADSAAMAAAHALDGTSAGVLAAAESARVAAIGNKYRFLNPVAPVWVPAALTLGPSATGPWTPVASVTATQARTLFYARVSTDQFGDSESTVSVTFLRVISSRAAQQKTAASAVAGRGMSTIFPLGICALESTELSKRVNGTGYDELLEFGFRRGVSYDLLSLSSYDTTPRHYIINPLAFPPAADNATHYTDEVLKPLACSGAMPAPALESGSTVYVRETFPSTLAEEINSRFNKYGGVCKPTSAPPDSNIRDFRGGYPGYWMNSGTALRPSAEPIDIGGRRLNVAHGTGAGATSTNYGPLWAFNRPLRFDSATGAGGAKFAYTDWTALYPTASGPKPQTAWASSNTPYEKRAVPHYIAPPDHTALSGRRMLNIPLLSCPVIGSTATLLGIGRFFLISPVSATLYPGIHGEFAGLTTYGKVAASTVLYK